MEHTPSVMSAAALMIQILTSCVTYPAVISPQLIHTHTHTPTHTTHKTMQSSGMALRCGEGGQRPGLVLGDGTKGGG
jgi:hypothetical protein